ncbi:MAG TPA: hypothetical protein VHA57_10630, partial [Actinomycetota bacterium]|nr:hypothetical protein [Actinomycetota bacterium]
MASGDGLRAAVGDGLGEEEPGWGDGVATGLGVGATAIGEGDADGEADGGDADEWAAFVAGLCAQAVRPS